MKPTVKEFTRVPKRSLWYISLKLRKDSDYLHKDGTWHKSMECTIDKPFKNYFDTKEEAETFLKEYLANELSNLSKRD